MPIGNGLVLLKHVPQGKGRRGRNLLVCGKYLKAINDLSKWDRRVRLPLPDRFAIFNVDDEVFFFAFVVDFGGCAGSARHDCWDLGVRLGRWILFERFIDYEFYQRWLEA